MATFDVTPLFRSTAVGFERAWDQLNTALSLDAAGYPAYDILQVSEDEYRISLAVPGFRQDEISVEARDRAVWIKGERSVDPNHNQYLFRGISTQAFQRNFQLPEHVHVKAARLEAGMLHVDLLRELPEELKPRRIEVRAEAEAPRALKDASRAA